MNIYIYICESQWGIPEESNKGLIIDHLDDFDNILTLKMIEIYLLG